VSIFEAVNYNHNIIGLLHFEDYLFWFVPSYACIFLLLIDFGTLGTRLEKEGGHLTWRFSFSRTLTVAVLSIPSTIFIYYNICWVLCNYIFSSHQHFHLVNFVTGYLCTWSLVLLMQPFDKERDFETGRPSGDKRPFCSWSRQQQLQQSGKCIPGQTR
jgi:hypothetical protein